MGAGFGVLEDGFADGQARKGLGQIDPATLVTQLQRPTALSAASRMSCSVNPMRSR
jgi:hypothetical protein